MKHQAMLRVVDSGQLNPPVVTVGMHSGDFCLPDVSTRFYLLMVERREPGVCGARNGIKRGCRCLHGTLLRGSHTTIVPAQHDKEARQFMGIPNAWLRNR